MRKKNEMFNADYKSLYSRHSDYKSKWAVGRNEMTSPLFVIASLRSNLNKKSIIFLLQIFLFPQNKS